ncbi:MAG: hypothetical protein ACLSTW_02190 [Faecalibacterium sp.]
MNILVFPEQLHEEQLESCMMAYKYSVLMSVYHKEKPEYLESGNGEHSSADDLQQMILCWYVMDR